MSVIKKMQLSERQSLHFGSTLCLAQGTELHIRILENYMCLCVQKPMLTKGLRNFYESYLGNKVNRLRNTGVCSYVPMMKISFFPHHMLRDDIHH